VRTGLAIAVAVALIAAWAPAALATGEPGSNCEGDVPTVQVECPRVTAAITSVAVKQKAILVGVETSSQARVQVFGQVSWRVRQPDGSNGGLTQAISAGNPRTVDGGTVTSFRVILEKTILRRLGRITPRQSLLALMTVRTTDLAGREVDHGFKLKLHGRDRH